MVFIKLMVSIAEKFYRYVMLTRQIKTCRNHILYNTSPSAS